MKKYRYPRDIYLIKVKNGKSYIGISSNLREREYHHLSGWTNEKLAKDMNKYGYEMFIIDVSYNENEDIKEYLYINKALDLGVELYNENTLRKEYLEAVREVAR